MEHIYLIKTIIDMEKHEFEKRQQDLRAKILPLIEASIDKADTDTAKKWTKLYNLLDRGW